MDGMIWLPEKSLSDARLAKPFSEIVAAWCNNWFTAAGWSVSDHWSRKLGAGETQLEAFELDNGVSCFISERSKVLIAGAMLGLPLEKGKPQKPDADLIAALSEMALADLSDRLATIQVYERSSGSTSDTSRQANGPLYQVAVGGKIGPPLLTLVANRQFLVRLAQSAAPRPRALVSPTSRLEAMQSSEVAVGAGIGTARLKLAQVHELGVGDVIAFDWPIEAPVDLIVDGSAAARAAVQIKINENILELELLRTLS